ncbi:nucleotidyltransferase family protein [Marinifaba aquimaris]|uniref:nucleotidyltransferase family protein n=1 Tax=Marinifaba aquimaris TaxID=2741323 RepID=UPI0031B5A42C
MSNWKNIVVNRSIPIISAMEILDKQSLRIILVLDGDGNLLGTLTDGDIRRAILNNISLETSVDKIMNAKPTTVNKGTNLKKIKRIMQERDLLQIPVLEKGRLVDLVSLKDLLKPVKQLNPVLLMAGGFGRRLGDLTKTCPKPMLKIGSKPIMETILESFVEAGFVNFYISVHYLPEVIRDYFGNGEQWGINITYIEEPKPLGTAGGLGLLPKLESSLPLIIMNCDLLTKLDFSNLLSFHYENNASLTMCARQYEYQIPYGVINTESGEVTGISEKPISTHFVNAGIYVIEPSLLNEISGDEYLDMPDLINNYLEMGRSIQVFPIHEYWLDIGKIDDFQKAQHDFNLEC